MKRASAIALAWVGLLTGGALPAQSVPPALELTVGHLKGSEDDGIAVYRGIPYAAPPIGDLRWRPPQPANEWPGVLDATRYGPICPQQRNLSRNVDHVLSLQGVGWMGRRLVQTMVAINGNPEISENCLTLNVQSGNVGGQTLQPVMVWIHGGGHQAGAGSMLSYRSNALVRRGIVQVTLNHRLGVLGFLAHPALSAESPHHSSGNYGMLDQIAALEWVRDHIRAFGGDPHKVTVFGQSSGGHSTGQLAASPLARGLFHRAIAMSGTGVHQLLSLERAVGGRKAAHAAGVQLAERLGVAESEDIPAALRATSVEELLAASGKGSGARPALHPNADGWVLPRTPFEVFAAGEAAAIPMIVGSTADEGLLFRGPLALPGSPFQEQTIDSAENYQAAMKVAFGVDAERMLQLYPVADDGSPEIALLRLFTDGYFGAGARFVASEQSKRKRPTWLYLFTRTPPGKYAESGAFHGADVPFTFGSPLPMAPEQKYDRELAETIGDYLVQFAKTGDPNQEGLPAWPAYQTANPQWQVWGERIGPAAVSRSEAYDAFDRRRARLLSESCSDC